ncbi:diacylglycerol/lipid kinase family protein [Lutibaculum baratangense]|uniref:DAGKc domain-containing protein n=1 Tax=Lutibaculum baratangense AMV1 TaxID=631454 RepID=V4RAG1_9HYPH|nr:diacylglycerol kinase family protein [Lutibaculum baratangense]ESR23166.1 hypothetical protein N177_3234 [Lutibaculum baratangense AMV1]
MRFIAVINREAGGVRRTGVRRLEEMAEETLGHQLVGLESARGRVFPSAVTAALAQRPDGLIAIGGDGTARTVAGYAITAGVPVTFAPAGTMNLLPRRLWGEREIEEVLAAIAAGEFCLDALPVAMIEGEPFFVAAAFGLVPAFGRIREHHRLARSWRRRLGALLQGLALGRRVFRPNVMFRSESRRTMRTPALIVTVGDADQLYPWRGVDAGIGGFECVSLRLEGWMDVLQLAGKTLLRRDWRDDERIESFSARRIVVSGRGRRLWMMVDGEPLWRDPPVRLRFSSSPMQVMASTDSPLAKARHSVNESEGS